MPYNQHSYHYHIVMFHIFSCLHIWHYILTFGRLYLQYIRIQHQLYILYNLIAFHYHSLHSQYGFHPHKLLYTLMVLQQFHCKYNLCQVNNLFYILLCRHCHIFHCQLWHCLHIWFNKLKEPITILYKKNQELFYICHIQLCFHYHILLQKYELNLHKQRCRNFDRKDCLYSYILCQQYI